MKKISKLLTLFLCLTLSLTACTSTSSTSGSSASTNSSSASDQASAGKETSSSPSSHQNDTDIGLKNTKIDNSTANLTADQKLVLSYYDRDYLSVPDYEFLLRYPNLYENAQLYVEGSVKKILSLGNGQYEALVWIGKSYDDFFYRSSYSESDYKNYCNANKDDLIVIHGQQGDRSIIPDDYISIYGRYETVKSYTIDGSGYTLPTISAQNVYIGDNKAFSAKQLKSIASVIFGDGITIREPIEGKDWSDLNGFYNNSFYICELDHQANAKFSKFRIYEYQALIDDATCEPILFSDPLFDPSVQRRFEFAADFNHYFVFTYELTTESLTLEYYDKTLQQIWKRTFDETTKALYDFTQNNTYLLVNNELYIINNETGDDVYPPSYVGEKIEIRKMNDGILLVAEGKSDAIMKTDLNGKLIWKINLPFELGSVSGIQIVDDSIIMDAYGYSDDSQYGTHYLKIASSDGSLALDAVQLQSSDDWMYQDYSYDTSSSEDWSSESYTASAYSPSSEYLFPSDSQYITTADLAGRSQQEVTLIRNEIYARHGYIFKSQDIQNYFAEKSWYYPNQYFDESLLNAVEKSNIDTIIAYEKQMGWRN